MALYTLITYAVLLVLSLVIFKKISNPIVFFNLIWTFLILVSLLSITGINVASDNVYKMFLLGGVTFNVVLSILYALNMFFFKNKMPKPKKHIIGNDVKVIIIVALNMLMLFYYIYKAFVVLRTAGAYGNYEEIRTYYYSTENFTSSFEYIMVIYLFDPMLYVDNVFASVNLFERRYSMAINILIIANLILRTIISGGRMILFEFAACIVITYFAFYLPYIKKSLNRNKHKGNLGIIFVVFMSLLIAAYITQLRGGQDKTLSQNVYSTLISNFTGSFSFFSVLDGYRKYLSGFRFRTIFAGIIDPIYMLLHFVKLSNSEIAQNSIGAVLSGFYTIGDHYYNAMPTMYYFFATDFGRVLGPVFGSAILAVYSFIADLRRRKNCTYKSYALYLFMMLTIVESSMTWLPFKTSFIIANIFVFGLISNDSIKKIYSSKNNKKGE